MILTWKPLNPIFVEYSERENMVRLQQLCPIFARTRQTINSSVYRAKTMLNANPTAEHQSDLDDLPDGHEHPQDVVRGASLLCCWPLARRENL